MLQPGSLGQQKGIGAMKEKYLAFILVMVLLTVLFFTLAANTMTGNLKRISEYDSKIKTAQEKLNSARIMDEQLSQFSMIIDNSLSKAPTFSFDEINAFKKQIGDMANDNRITINKLSDSNKFSLPGLIESTYNMELEGSYVQMGQFIADLESLDNIIKIHYIDVSPTQAAKDKSVTTDGVSRYRITIELSIFKVKKEV